MYLGEIFRVNNYVKKAEDILVATPVGFGNSILPFVYTLLSVVFCFSSVNTLSAALVKTEIYTSYSGDGGAYAACISDSNGKADEDHRNSRRCHSFYGLKTDSAPNNVGFCYGEVTKRNLVTDIWFTHNFVDGGNYCYQEGYYFDNSNTKYGSVLYNVFYIMPSCPNGTTPDQGSNRCNCDNSDIGGQWDEATQSCQSPLDIAANRGHSCDDNSQGNPIHIGIGNKFQAETDFLGVGLFPFNVSRNYNSSTNWQFFPNLKFDLTFTKVKVVRASGKAITFDLVEGTFISILKDGGNIESILDSEDEIIGWRYTTLDQQIEDYDAQGRLTSVASRSGITHTYTYTTNDITVTYSEGDVLIYQLDTEGRISGFTDPDNNQYTYNYDTEGRLTGVIYPNNGGARTYHYEDANHLNALTGITDANGDRYATWTYDSQGRATSSTHHNGSNDVDTHTIDYTHLDDPIDPRATVTNPLGKQTTYHFTTIHGVRKVTQVEGHQSANCAAANKAYTYDANGFLETKTDWKGNVTRYTRNAKGQELTRIESENTPEERTITTEWHSTFNVPTKITELERVTDFTYDANGNQLTKVVTDTAP